MNNSQNEDLTQESASNSIPEEVNIREEEVDLNKSLKTIIKRKKLVVGAFLIAVFVGVIISLCKSKVYQASASIIVMPSGIQRVLSPTEVSLSPKKGSPGVSADVSPSISIPTHASLLKSTSVLQKILERLMTEGVLEERLTCEELSEKLTVEQLEDTNILRLLARDTDPDVATRIANVWTEEYVQYSMEMIGGELTGSGDFIVQRFEEAKKALEDMEGEISDFNLNERLPLMQIELEEMEKQLKTHYANVQQLGFALDSKRRLAKQIEKEYETKEEIALDEKKLAVMRKQFESHYNQIQELRFTLQQKRQLLREVNQDITAMSRDGIWLGSFDVRADNLADFADNSLSEDQKILRTQVLKRKRLLDETLRKRDDFVRELRLDLLRNELTRRREALVGDRLQLARLRQFRDSTNANLESKGKLKIFENFEGPIAQNLTDLSLWEILSLWQGHNYFGTRAEVLSEKIEHEAQEVKELESVLIAHEYELKRLNHILSDMQAAYGFFEGKFQDAERKRDTLKSEITVLMHTMSYSEGLVNSIGEQLKSLALSIDERKRELKTTLLHTAELEIAPLEFKLSYSKEMCNELESKVKEHRKLVRTKVADFAEINRRLEICRRAYGTMLSKLEEARISKAMKLGEVKLVSEAFPPEQAVGLGRRHIVMILALVGLVLGIFSALYLDAQEEKGVA